MYLWLIHVVVWQRPTEHCKAIILQLKVVFFFLKKKNKINNKKECTGNIILKGILKSESHLVVSGSLRPHGLYSPWNSPGQNTGVDSLSLLQGVFPTQQLNQCLLHCRQILYQLSYQGRPYTSYTSNLSSTSYKSHLIPLIYLKSVKEPQNDVTSFLIIFKLRYN